MARWLAFRWALLRRLENNSGVFGWVLVLARLYSFHHNARLNKVVHSHTWKPKAGSRSEHKNHQWCSNKSGRRKRRCQDMLQHGTCNVGISLTELSPVAEDAKPNTTVGQNISRGMIDGECCCLDPSDQRIMMNFHTTGSGLVADMQRVCMQTIRRFTHLFFSLKVTPDVSAKAGGERRQHGLLVETLHPTTHSERAIMDVRCPACLRRILC